jgi:asparagine N-glycosylation enzyme membrane subunit Stt3
VKLLTTLLIAVLAALAVYSARRRIVFALKTGAVVYIVLLFGRLILSAGSFADRWEDILWPVLIMLVGWVILWWISTTYAERRGRKTPGPVTRVKSASGAGRPGR